MKKKVYFLFILCLWLCNIYAQENAISISNLTVKSNLPPELNQWRSIPAALLMVAQNNTWGDRAVKMIITIKKGNARVCGNTDGVPLDYFKTRSFQANDLLAGLNNCEALQPGDYTLCVLFKGMDNTNQWVNVSAEICKSFSVGGGSSASQTFTQPSIISPENGKVFTEKELQQPLVLRCTPVVPKPQEPVIYHYRIWQVAAAQTPVQAMTSQPVVEKEVENLTQTNITSGLFPCTNCQYLCNVQATNKEGKPYGKNNGTSEAVSFTFSDSESPDLPLNVEIVHPNITRPCIKCNNLQINSGNATVSMNSTSGLLSISQPLTISPDAVKQLITAIVYTEWKPQDEKCMPCNKDLRQWGILQSAALTNNGSVVANPPVSASDAQWSINAMINNGVVQLKLQFPALLSCCNLTGKVCVRYKFIVQPATGECYECEKLICYTF